MVGEVVVVVLQNADSRWKVFEERVVGLGMEGDYKGMIGLRG